MHVPPEQVPPAAGHAAAHAAAAASCSAVIVEPSGGDAASPPPLASAGAIASPESSTPASFAAPSVVRFGALTHAANAAAEHAEIDATTRNRTIL